MEITFAKSLRPWCALRLKKMKSLTAKDAKDAKGKRKDVDYLLCEIFAPLPALQLL